MAKLPRVLPHHAVSLLGDSLVYLVGAGLIGLGNVILVPLYTRCLSASEFGAYALMDATVLLLTTVAQLGFGITYLKWYADSRREAHGQLLWSTILASTVAGLLASSLLVATASAPWAPYWLAQHRGSLISVLLALIPLETLQSIFLADLRARRKSTWFCFAAILRLFIIAAATVWLVRFQQQGLVGVFLGRLIGTAASAVMLAILCLGSVAVAFSWPLVRDMLRYGAPLVWSALVGVALDALGRYLLAHYTTLEQVAIYTVALKISAIMQVTFLQPFGTAWSGSMFQLAREDGAPQLYTKILGTAFVVGMTVASGITMFSPIVLPLFGNIIYASAVTLVPWLLLPFALRILEYWSSIGLYLTNRTSHLAVLASIGAVLNVGGNLLWIPRYGASGAALAWVISLLVIITLSAAMARRGFPLPVDWRPALIGTCIWSFGLVVSRWIPVEMSLRSIMSAAAGSVVVVAALLFYVVKTLPSLQPQTAPPDCEEVSAIQP